jgi:hypothetical protein
MVFYINFLPGAVMLAAIAYAIDSQPPNFDLLRRGDWFGIGCMAIGLGSLIAFLEEGQNQDWFTSTFIQHCFELALVFIPLFLIIEIFGKHPVVNLPLLLERNLALASIVNFVMGAGLHGSVFLLPQYLEQVQQYSARQTERVTSYSLQVQSFLNSQAAQYDKQGGDPVTAMKHAYKSLQAAVQVSSFVMAFSECFLLVGSVLLAGSLVVWFCRKTKAAGGAPAGH